MRAGLVVSVSLGVVGAIGCGSSDAVMPAATVSERAEPSHEVASHEAASQEAPARSAPEGPSRAPCAAMPAELAAGTWVRFAQHDRRRPDAMRRWDVVASGGACPADELPAHLGYARPTCVPLEASAMRALYAALRAHRLAELRVHPMAPTPHRSEYTIGVRFPGGQCDLSIAAGETEMEREDTGDFRAAVDTVITAINRAR